MVSNAKPAPQSYKIKVLGELDQGWETYFNGLVITHDCTCEGNPTTTLIGSVADQAALRGLLCKLWDLNLTLIAFHWMDKDLNTEQT